MTFNYPLLWSALTIFKRWRVFSSLAGLDSNFLNALQNAKQLFHISLPQMTKYCVTRECENIRNGYLYVMTQNLLILKGIYGFKFPKRFLEISSRDLTFLSILIIYRPDYPILVPIPFTFARLNALQAAVKHSHNMHIIHSLS